MKVPSETKAEILARFPLGLHWQTYDPFLFCAHHRDLYPKGNGRFGPTEGLSGRNIGSDFELKDGYRMYHGTEVPGFPAHPHRGFETITVVTEGLVDHADSLGAAGRYGEGDVQWLTAGRGLMHSEMFPLLREQERNPVELFQIWLNLEAAKKLSDPTFTMFWSQDIPVVTSGASTVRVIAGAFAGQSALEPPKDSWAARPESEVAVWNIRLKGDLVLPKAAPGLNRCLYFYDGAELSLNGEAIAAKTGLKVRSDQALNLRSQEGAGILILQGRPIAEPVVQHGPFVMNSREGIATAIRDYQNGKFGTWPWPRDDMVHGKEVTRFARFEKEEEG